MPNCFTLTRLNDLAAGPVILQKIDDEMRLAFGEPPGPKYWLYGWYDLIGLLLALGKDWDQIRECYKECPDLVRATDWLEANFTPNAWAERR